LHYHLSELASTLAKFNKKLRYSRDGTPKHTQTILDVTQKETVIAHYNNTAVKRWYAKSPNHTEVFVHFYYGNYTLMSSRTLLSDYFSNCPICLRDAVHM
jgi:hypothetical protein